MAEKRKITVAGLLAIALIVKLIYIANLPQAPVISSDAELYSNLAENFLKGDGLVNTIRDREYVVGPVYPLFTALTFALFGIGNYHALMLFQVFISSLTAVFMYKLGQQLWGKGYGWILYALFLLYPPFTFWNTWMITETVYVFFMVLLIYGAVCYRSRMESESTQWALFIGISLGVANLVRPLLLFFLPLLLVWLVGVNRRNWKKALRDGLLAGLMVIIIMLPWGIRNFIKYGEFIAVSNYGGQELYAGNNPYTTTNEPFTFELATYDPLVLDRILHLPVLEQEKGFKREAEKYILAHPLKFLQRTGEKALNLFWRPLEAWEGAAYGMNFWEWDRYFMGLGLLGGGISLFQWKKYSFLLLLIAYYSSVVSAITVVSGGRYRLPVMVGVMVLAMLPLISFSQVMKELLLKIKERKTVLFKKREEVT